MAAMVLVIEGQAVAAAADAAQADLDRAVQLAARGDCRSAIPIFEQSYQSNPRPSTLLHLARCHEKTGDRDTARAYYKSIVDDGRNPDAVGEARKALASFVAVPPPKAAAAVRKTAPARPRFGVTGAAGPLLALPFGFFGESVNEGRGQGRVVRRNANQIRYCYELGLRRSIGASGRVNVQFLIGANGAVLSSMIQSSDLGDTAAEQCIAAAVRRWAFPAPAGGGTVMVNYPFLLRATGE